MMPTKDRPGTERIHIIDFIRGIALLGILIMNSQTYSLFAFLRPEQVYEWHLDWPNPYAPVQFFIHLFVKGQFYTLYSFLFGLGFYLMWEKNKRAGLDADRIFKRRLWTLFALGVVHAFLFWFGDILHKYALLGFTLLYFNRKSTGTLLKWIVGLVVFGVAVQLILTVVFPATPESIAHSQQQFDAVMLQVITTWQHGSFWDVMRLQKLGVLMLHVAAVQHGLVSYLHYEILFLLGLMVGKMRLFNRLPAVREDLFKVAFLVYPFALVLKGVSALPVFEINLLPAQWQPYENLIFSLAELIGTPLLTLFYLIELSIHISPRPSRFSRWIANTGRLGLTNYLVQTGLCMVLFYGYALGLSSRLSLLESVVLVLGIYGFQVLYSNLWLTYFPQGPVESLWRRLTYGKRQQAPASTPFQSRSDATGWKKLF